MTSQPTLAVPPAGLPPTPPASRYGLAGRVRKR